MNNLISIVTPVYNEEKVIKRCLQSLLSQSYKPMEIILVDDGSSDRTLRIISNFNPSSTKSRRGREFPISNFQLLEQNHKGPGSARNLGASKAHGEILVFVDADMTFDRDFIKDLVNPILDSRTIGTFSKNEMVANYNNIWSICWNINRNVPKDRMLPPDYPNQAPVFRAILKKEFNKVGGFDATGEYTDDWSLSRKLNIKSTLAPGAVYFHSNPTSLKEVFKQARWIGKNEFISGSLLRKIRSLFLYNLLVSILIGIFKSTVTGQLSFVVFKIIYDLGVFVSVIRSFFQEPKFK
ncbi:MAG: hyaluronan synthase-like protein [uncultured bacterium]|uniref:Glycosyltransferase 2-like domain-containing protein n=1 Tax=Candidatus Curtissbacteria bacterium RIFOXYA1_FULL_41_14 TaxID=1797737 RepID=A0A1F5HAI5_9BACT|nr:MAG: hyaluronan synthase-like protein [uncultured bacterium]KKR58854.1 MAG: hypothetical protein UT95_C0001G0113 [Candidatus Curtissbacteria bacterium GW2011_GWB1_40_28]KKR62399.1 MAG: hyaluronan synthase-like protein [Microgenomates group bacterium GW2011_GWC1_40_35]KKR66400.1 MAG: hypothetical protein UU05_C0001G0024 [Candidatus Curtissbacteria bacterium GW2011_GWA1_40_47]KKR75158.1 MAG: hypothetical protein UU19_C0065G0004 [Candidatus Curtissbacteria bacterium GW2011_GWD1_40_8]KKS02567.1